MAGILTDFLPLAAEPRGEVVHREAVLPEAVRGGGVSLHGGRGDCGGVGKCREYHEPAGGDFAAVFGRGVVAGGKRVRQQLHEARRGLGLEPPQSLLLAGRDKAGDRHHSMPRLRDDLLYRRLMLGYCLLEGEPYVKQKRRAEYRQRADGVEAARRKRREALALYRAVADEEVGVPRLPDGSGWVEFYVPANGLQLPRVERQLDVAVAGEDDGTDGGARPRTPAPHSKPEASLDLQLAWRCLASGGRGLAQQPGHKLDPPLVKRSIASAVACGPLAHGGWGAAPLVLPRVSGLRGEAPSVPLLHERLGPLDGVGEAVGNEKRRNALVAIVIDDEEKVEVVWHNNVVAYRDGGPNPVNRPQGCGDYLAKRQKRRPRCAARCGDLPARLQLGDARQHLPPLGDNKRHKEKLQAPLGVFKFHRRQIIPKSPPL